MDFETLRSVSITPDLTTRLVLTQRYVSLSVSGTLRAGLERFALVALAAAAAALAVAASGSANGGSLVKVGPTRLGRVLVDAHGKTLYI